MELLSSIERVITHMSSEKIMSLVRIAILLAVGLPFLHFFSKSIRRLFTKRLSEQPGMIAGKIVYYTGIFIILFSTLNELGFNLNTLLGAAGIVGIAVGFASQTSISNVISGIFLMMERPFVINDTIAIDDISGQVLSIDLLSVKLKTEDNRYIRIPNESIIKNKLTNVTRFPIRRVDLRLAIAFTEDIPTVQELLLKAAGNEEKCLRDPAPQTVLSGFGPASVDIIFSVWAKQQDWQILKNSLLQEINTQFKQEGIRIPTRNVFLHKGNNTEPFPVRILETRIAPQDT